MWPRLLGRRRCHQRQEEEGQAGERRHNSEANRGRRALSSRDVVVLTRVGEEGGRRSVDGGARCWLGGFSEGQSAARSLVLPHIKRTNKVIGQL